MKTLLTLASIIFSLNVLAADYYPVTINWNSRHLDETVVLMCDDSYYDGVEVDLPGVVKYPESTITYKDCSADWKVLKSQVVTVKGRPVTRVRLSGSSSCSIEIREKVPFGEKAKIFLLEVGDAC